MLANTMTVDQIFKEFGPWSDAQKSPQVTVEENKRYSIVAYRNHYMHGFAIGVVPKGDQVRYGLYAIMGWNKRPSQRAFNAALADAREYASKYFTNKQPHNV